MKINLIISILFLAFLFSACNNRPSNVLSENKMKKVLYDVYLAEAEINANYNAFSSDSVRKQELLNSVLKKYKITEAVLDTSLAWYSGRLDAYLKINESVGKRYAETAEKLRREAGMPAKTNHVTTADQMLLPVGKEHFFLKSSDLLNNAFSYKADTVLNRYGGTYDLQFNILGITDSLRPVVTLCVQCLDTVFVKRDTINRNGSYKTSLEVLQGKQAKKLYGSIYFPNVNPEMTVLVRDFIIIYSSRTRILNLPATQPPK